MIRTAFTRRAELDRQLLVGGVDGRAVAQPVQLHHLLGQGDPVLGVLGPEHGQHRAQLLPGQRLVPADRTDLDQQDRGVLRHREPGPGGDPARLTGRRSSAFSAAPPQFSPWAVDTEQQLLQGGLLLGVAAVGVQPGELGHGRLVDLGVEDDGLLGGADHPVVEGLRQHQVVDRPRQVRGLLHVRGHVAGAHAEGGLAAGVGGPHHRVAAGGQDGGDVGVVHQLAGGPDRRVLDPLDAVLRRAGRDRRVPDDPGGLRRAPLRGGMEPEHDRVPGLQREQALEDRRGGGVGDRGDAGDDADRLGDLGDPGQVVVARSPRRCAAPSSSG